MIRALKVLIAGLLVMGLSATAALAANPHQVGQTKVTQSGNSLTIEASIAGLGNTLETVDFTLSGSIDVFSRCYNRGGNKPQADNKQETLDVNATGTFPVRNGRTNVSFTVTPLSTLSCPGNQTVVIESFSYDLTITGEGVVINVSG